ncbi:hypothetical protein BC938DRAFT_473593 [Jimgerdemannia flammicorona]|uniref:F-box domain-containing protein n=1 Tax=Jimgerdemannia flammicorona TaxID=994334 RepID=A0A433Q3V3_9FUNG|nr:hypothetical protein BC938DRAFT_473593 [Jimgerdemannia flammicorona]
MRAEAEMRACGGAVDGPPRASGFTSPTCVPFVCAEMGDASRTSTRVPRWIAEHDTLIAARQSGLPLGNKVPQRHGPRRLLFHSSLPPATLSGVDISAIPTYHQEPLTATQRPCIPPHYAVPHSPVRAMASLVPAPTSYYYDAPKYMAHTGYASPPLTPPPSSFAMDMEVPHIFRLPDTVLLQVFSYVTLADKFRVAGPNPHEGGCPNPTYTHILSTHPHTPNSHPTPSHPTPLHPHPTPLHPHPTPLHPHPTPLHPHLTPPNPSSPLPTTPHSLLLPTPYYSPLPTTPYSLLLPTPYSLLLPTPYHSPLSSTCRYWHNLASDPHLFRHVHIADLEFRPLVLLLRELYRLATGLRSLTISNCFSDFLKNTTVPMGHVPGLRHHGQLFSHITVLRPERRREEYAIQGFTLHREFSDALLDLMRQNEQHLRALRLHDCHLDLEMSDLVFAIVRYGRALEEIAYENNSDRGLGSQSSLSAIVAACPNIRTFRGVHDAMGDAVLTRMATGWRELRCLTVANGRPAAGDAYDNEAGACGIISSEAFWKLLTECPQLEELELLDLECVSNQNLAAYVHMAAAVAEQRLSSTLSTTRRDHTHQHHPYRRARSSYSYSAPPALPGSRLATVNITKNTSHPLSLSGFQSLVALFPSLRRLDYKTTFAAFDNEFENITPYENVRATVAEWFAEQAPQIKYDGCWTVETFVARMNVVPQEMV